VLGAGWEYAAEDDVHSRDHKARHGAECRGHLFPSLSREGGEVLTQTGIEMHGDMALLVVDHHFDGVAAHERKRRVKADAVIFLERTADDRFEH